MGCRAGYEEAAASASVPRLERIGLSQCDPIWFSPFFGFWNARRRDAVSLGHGFDGRACDLPGIFLQNTTVYSGKSAPFNQWVNELKLDRERSLLFVHYGLRPAYPDDRSRDTLSYFRGANGEDFRYEKTTWGSRFVQRVNDQPQVAYARAYGDTHAPGDKNGGGNVAGWIFYNENGPSVFIPTDIMCSIRPWRVRRFIFHRLFRRCQAALTRNRFMSTTSTMAVPTEPWRF